jgi:3-hydroxybutyryl-CoA dehydratase
MTLKPADRDFESLTEGTRAQSEYRITPEIFAQFVSLSGDLNPLHMDEGYARAAGFEGCVAHGAILNAFLSAFVGMVLPGRRSMLLSTDLRYLAPSYIGDTISVEGIVEQRVDSQRVLVLGCRFHNRTRDQLVARARVQVKVRDEGAE